MCVCNCFFSFLTFFYQCNNYEIHFLFNFITFFYELTLTKTLLVTFLSQVLTKKVTHLESLKQAPRVYTDTLT
jgi:hypothetical protein